MGDKKALNFAMNTDKVHSTIAEATAAEEKTEQEAKARKERKTYSEEEIAELKLTLKTGGKKGVHLPRINMAFTQDVYDFIKTMSKGTGQTYTEFVNVVLYKYMEDNKELYEQIKAFRNSL